MKAISFASIALFGILLVGCASSEPAPAPAPEGTSAAPAPGSAPATPGPLTDPKQAEQQRIEEAGAANPNVATEGN